MDEIKRIIFSNYHEIDDPIDVISKHTMLHDAVICNRKELFYFLLKQGANPMVRDANGYTPLLKAASLNRMEMTKYLIEEAKVDPRHVDPYGVTPREKSELYQFPELSDYLLEAERKAKSGEFIPKHYDDFRRTSKMRSWFDY